MLNTLCGSVINLPGFKNIGGVVSVNCKVYIRILQFYTSKIYTYYPPTIILRLYKLDYQNDMIFI